VSDPCFIDITIHSREENARRKEGDGRRVNAGRVNVTRGKISERLECVDCKRSVDSS